MRFANRLSLLPLILMLASGCGGTAAPGGSPAAASAAKPAAGASASAKPAASAAAASASAKPAASAAAKTVGPSFTFKLATPSPETDLSGDGVKFWAKLVDERTGGRI